MLALSTLLIMINSYLIELLLYYIFLLCQINLKLILMQVSNANILNPKGMLYNTTLDLIPK